MLKGNRSGVTLIELIITVSLLSVIILTATSVLGFGEKIFSNTSAEDTIRNEALKMQSVIASRIRESRSIDSISNSPAQLLMTDKDGKNMRFKHNSSEKTVLFIDDTTGKVNNVFKNVSSLNFNRITNGVYIELELALGNVKYSLQTELYRRY